VLVLRAAVDAWKVTTTCIQAKDLLAFRALITPFVREVRNLLTQSKASIESREMLWKLVFLTLPVRVVLPALVEMDTMERSASVAQINFIDWVTIV
jgi:hypothetical protein